MTRSVLAWCFVLSTGCARTVVVSVVDDDAGDPADASIGPCAPGETRLPVAASVGSTWAPNNACDVGNALLLDGEVAGLDLSGSTSTGCLDLGIPESPCGCVALDFGSVLSVERATVHMARTGDACGRGCSGSQCDSGPTAWVSWGLDETGYIDLERWREVRDVGANAIQPYSVVINDQLRWVVVCRVAWSADRDDMAVDAVTVTCR